MMEVPKNCLRWSTLRLRRQSREVAWGFRLAGGLQENCKLFVTRVTPGSPAALGGLQKNDIIELIDGINGTELTYSDAMQILQRSNLLLTLETLPNGCARDQSYSDLNSMLSASHSRNTSFGAGDGQTTALSDCLSPSSSVVNLLQTHNPAPMTAWSMAQPAFRRVNSQEARSPLVQSATSTGSVAHFEYPPTYQTLQQAESVGGGGQLQQLNHTLGQAVRRRNASSLARSPGYHSYVRQLQQYSGSGGGNAWDPPDPLSGLRRSSSAATLPHSFRPGAPQPPPQQQQPLYQQQYPQQPQAQVIPDKLLGLYQSGASERKPFSYTPDNQQLERELQDAFMRRRRSRPRHRSTSTEFRQQSNPCQYERSTSLVADRSGYNHEATSRFANDITRYFAADAQQSPPFGTGEDAGHLGTAQQRATYQATPVQQQPTYLDTMTLGRPNYRSQTPVVPAQALPEYQQQKQSLQFPSKQERKVSTSSVTLSCQPSNQYRHAQQQQQQSAAGQPAGNQSFRVLQWLSNSTEMQNSSVRDEVKQKLSNAGTPNRAASQLSSANTAMSHQAPQPAANQQHPAPANHVNRSQPTSAPRLSSSVCDLRGSAGGTVPGGPAAFQRLNSAVNSPMTTRAALTRQQQLQQRRQQRQAEQPDAYDAIRATIRANQQARGQLTTGVGTADRKTGREEPNELSHNAKFQRIREKLQQQQLLLQQPADNGHSQRPPDSDVLREDHMDSAARIQELKQIQQSQNLADPAVSNGRTQHESLSAIPAADQTPASSLGLTEF